jgi:hypothetical protein
VHPLFILILLVFLEGASLIGLSQNLKNIGHSLIEAHKCPHCPQPSLAALPPLMVYMYIYESSTLAKAYLIKKCGAIGNILENTLMGTLWELNGPKKIKKEKEKWGLMNACMLSLLMGCMNLFIF